jgi:hypothetical protein
MSKIHDIVTNVFKKKTLAPDPQTVLINEEKMLLSMVEDKYKKDFSVYLKTLRMTDELEDYISENKQILTATSELMTKRYKPDSNKDV